MAEQEARQGWRPTPTTLVAGGVVIAGFWLSSLSWWFFLLVGVGAFGPGILRETGLLRDRDEFQRRADHRAGYHAFLAAGLLAVSLVAWFRSGERMIENAERLATLFLVLLWFTWFLSTMLAYWGPQRAAAWILRVFGSVVLVFTIVSNLGPEWTGWAALLLHPLLALPFFGLAWSAGRWPRVSGVLLLGAFALFFWLLGGLEGRVFDLEGTFILTLGPLLAGGIALLFGEREEADSEEEIEA